MVVTRLHLLQNTAATVVFQMVDDVDRVTPETGLTTSNFVVNVSKAGSAFSTVSRTLASVSSALDGRYSIALTAADTDVAGQLVIVIVDSTGNAIGNIEAQVGALDPIIDALSTLQAAVDAETEDLDDAVLALQTTSTAIETALIGVDAVELTQPLVGSVLQITRGIAYNNNPTPKLVAYVNSTVDITGWTGKLTIRAIDDDGSGTALLTLSTSGGEITLVSGTQYKVEFTCTQANSNSLTANLTLSEQSLTQWVDGFDEQVRWDADYNQKFDVVVESGTNRLEGPSGIVLVKEKQTT